MNRDRLATAAVTLCSIATKAALAGAADAMLASVKLGNRLFARGWRPWAPDARVPGTVPIETALLIL